MGTEKPLPDFGVGNGNEKECSQLLGFGTQMRFSAPKFWECEEKKQCSPPNLGKNGLKSLLKKWEREIPLMPAGWKPFSIVAWYQCSLAPWHNDSLA